MKLHKSQQENDSVEQMQADSQSKISVEIPVIIIQQVLSLQTGFVPVCQYKNYAHKNC